MGEVKHSNTFSRCLKRGPDLGESGKERERRGRGVTMCLVVTGVEGMYE